MNGLPKRLTPADTSAFPMQTKQTTMIAGM